MNKKIAVLTFAMFTGSIEMNAAISQEQLKAIRADAVTRYLAGTLPSDYCRDDYGVSRIGVQEIDDERNKAENGGPSLSERQKAAIDSQYQAIAAKPALTPVRTASEVTCTDVALRVVQKSRQDLEKLLFTPSPKAQLREIEKRIQTAEELAAAQLSKAVVVQIQAKTKEERFKIAMEEIETSPELQDYAAAFAAARK